MAAIEGMRPIGIEADVLEVEIDDKGGETTQRARPAIVTAGEQVRRLERNAEVLAIHAAHHVEAFLHRLAKRPPMGLLGERDPRSAASSAARCAWGISASLCNMMRTSVAPSRSARSRCGVMLRRQSGASALLAASGTLPMTMDAFRSFVSRIVRTACCSSMACSTEMAEARIDMPVKPADAASGASAPIGIAAMSFRVDDSAIRQERESCNDLAVEGYVDVAERAEICDHLVSGFDIKRFAQVPVDDLSGFNGETKSGYFLDEPAGRPVDLEDIRTDAVVNFPADRFDGRLMLREIDGTPVGFRSGAKNEFVSAGVVRDQLGFANGGEIFRDPNPVSRSRGAAIRPRPTRPQAYILYAEV